MRYVLYLLSPLLSLCIPMDEQVPDDVVMMMRPLFFNNKQPPAQEIMDSRTVLWYVVLAAIACLGVAMTTLAYVNMVNFPPSDATLTKDLAVYSDIVKAAPLGCPSDNVLCDYYMSSSGYTVIPSTTVYTLHHDRRNYRSH